MILEKNLKKIDNNATKIIESMARRNKQIKPEIVMIEWKDGLSPHLRYQHLDLYPELADLWMRRQEIMKKILRH